MRGRVVVLATAGMLLTAGCGGEEDERARPNAKAKRFHERSAKFHRQGVALCRDFARETAAITRALLRGEGSAAIARVLDVEERFNRRFAALNAPSREAARLQRRAAAVNRAGERVSDRVYARVQAGTPLQQAVAPDRPALRRIGRQNDRLYRRLGLPECTRAEFRVLVRGNL